MLKSNRLLSTIAISLLPCIANADSHNGNFNQSILNAHNNLRAMHSAPSLTWDSALANFAAQHAQQCDFKHSSGPYGENISMGYSSPNAAVQGWYDEIKDYNFSNPGYSSQTGHFTQVIWASTRKLGCAQAQCPDQNGNQSSFVVCEYSPAGNITNEGMFAQNVLPSKSAAPTRQTQQAPKQAEPEIQQPRPVLQIQQPKPVPQIQQPKPTPQIQQPEPESQVQRLEPKPEAQQPNQQRNLQQQRQQLQQRDLQQLQKQLQQRDLQQLRQQLQQRLQQRDQ